MSVSCGGQGATLDKHEAIGWVILTTGVPLSWDQLRTKVTVDFPVVQWLRVHLPMEATQVWSLVQKLSQMMGQLRPGAATTEDKRYGARVPACSILSSTEASTTRSPSSSQRAKAHMQTARPVKNKNTVLVIPHLKNYTHKGKNYTVIGNFPL